MGPVIYAWVESTPRLEWRWIWWLQSSAYSTVSLFLHIQGLTLVTRIVTIGALFPFILLIMRETRESVILRRRAAKLRKEHQSGDNHEKGYHSLFQAPDGVIGRFTARSEMNRIGFWEAMRTSALRPFSMYLSLLLTPADRY